MNENVLLEPVAIESDDDRYTLLNPQFELSCWFIVPSLYELAAVHVEDPVFSMVTLAARVLPVHIFVVRTLLVI